MRERVWSFVAGLLALALVVAAAPAPARVAHTARSVGQAIIDGGSPPLHVAVDRLAGAVTHAARRAGGDGAPAWIAAPLLRAVHLDASRVAPAGPALASHAVAAAGFDATAPPAA